MVDLHRDWDAREVYDFTEMKIEADVCDFTEMGMEELYDFTEMGDCMQMIVSSLRW